MSRASSATSKVTTSKRMSNCTCPTRLVELVPLLNTLAIIIILAPFHAFYSLTQSRRQLASTSLAYTFFEFFCIERKVELPAEISIAINTATRMSEHHSCSLVGLREYIRAFACTETTLFYPQRGIPLSCTFSYSH